MGSPSRGRAGPGRVHPRRAERGSVRILLPIAAVVAAAGIAAGLLLSGGSRTPTVRHRPGPARDLSAGFDGSTGWRISASGGFEVTADAGAVWTPDPLPATVDVGEVQAASTAPGAPTLVVAQQGQVLTVLHQVATGGRWQRSTVPVPPGMRAPAPRSILLSRWAGGGFVLVDGVLLGDADERIAVFAAARPAAAPTLVDTSTDPAWQAIAFASSERGVVLEGSGSGMLRYTADGGRSWSASRLPSGLDGGTLGPPLTAGGRFLVPVVDAGPTGRETVRLLASGTGRAFAGTGATLYIPAADSPTAVSVAANGRAIWAFANGLLFVTGSSAQHWSQVATSTLPSGVLSASLVSPSAGAVVADDRSCSNGTGADCATSVQTWSSVDGGRRWAVQ